MIVLTGASGMVGPPAIAALRARGQTLRALTSSEGSAVRLKTLGVRETVIGDFRTGANLQEALAGADTLIHIPPALAHDEHEIGFRVIEAAKVAGVQHFIFVSVFHPQILDMPHHHNKLVVELALIKSGLTYTILQPAMFMQNVNTIWAMVEGEGRLEWPWAPDKKCTMIDTGDLGEAIAAVATEPRLRGGAYELCSSSSVSVNDMAEILTKVWNRPIRTGRIDPDAWAASMRAIGMPDWRIDEILPVSRFYDQHGLGGGNSLVLKTLLGREPRTYEEFARKFIAEKEASTR